jgi:hypothetical protein
MTPRLFVIVNVAVSAYGKTDTAARQGAAISSSRDASVSTVCGRTVMP